MASKKDILKKQKAASKNGQRTQPTPTLARVVRPEDVRIGSYITLLHVIDEKYPLFLTACDFAVGLPDPVTIRHLPWNAPTPLKVIDVCLPFVLVQPPVGQAWMLDVRRAELAQLDRAFALHCVDRLSRRGKKRLKRGKRRKRSRRCA